MDSHTVTILCALLMVAALLYTSVGHAGASAYLAAMALVGIQPDVMKPTALALNVLVASFTTWRFWREGHVDFRLVLPFALASVPMAYLGGRIDLPSDTYRQIVGIVLLIAAARLLIPKSRALGMPNALRPVPLAGAMGGGAAIGLLSGLTGTGGGIFLSPLLLFMGWATPRRAAGASAVFILLNSIAGLTGKLSSVGKLPHELPWFIGAVAIGAVIGTRLGLSVLPVPRLVQMLGVVLAIAGCKLVLT